MSAGHANIYGSGVVLCRVVLLTLFFSLFAVPLLSWQMAVLKKHHRAARYGHYYECLVKFKGVAYNKVHMCVWYRPTVSCGAGKRRPLYLGCRWFDASRMISKQ